MIKNILIKTTVSFLGIMFFLSFGQAANAQTFISQDQKNQKVVEQIRNYYTEIKTFSTQFSQVNSVQGSNISVEGSLYYQAPNKIKSDVVIQGMGDTGDKIKTITVFDGEFLWQQQNLADEKKVNVMKSTINQESEQGQNLLRQFDFSEQLDYLFKEYNVIDFKEDTLQEQKVNVLNLEIKEAPRNKLTQLIKAKGYKSTIDIIPEKVLIFADIKQGKCLKIDTLNAKHKIISTISYKDTNINPSFAPDFFIYNVPEGANVMDMTKMLDSAKAAEENASNKMLGEKCPEFSLLDLNGNTYDYKEYQDKIVIIDFWATWCPPCKKELPLIQKLFDKYKEDDQVMIFTVSNEPKDDLLNFVFQNKFTFHVLIDKENELAQFFKVISIPSLFVIDQKGQVAKSYIGFYEDILEKLESDIATLKK